LAATSVGRTASRIVRIFKCVYGDKETNCHPTSVARL
jgi:hypothetical protein